MQKHRTYFIYDVDVIEDLVIIHNCGADCLLQLVQVKGFGQVTFGARMACQ